MKNKFNQLFNILMEDVTKSFNIKYCHIIGKEKLFQPKNNQLIQCLYIDKHLIKQLNNRIFNGEIDYFTYDQILIKIKKFIQNILDDQKENQYIKTYSNLTPYKEADFGIGYMCLCGKSKLGIKIFLKYDHTFKRFYAFVKTLFFQKNYSQSQYHP